MNDDQMAKNNERRKDYLLIGEMNGKMDSLLRWTQKHEEKDERWLKRIDDRISTHQEEHKRIDREITRIKTIGTVATGFLTFAWTGLLVWWKSR